MRYRIVVSRVQVAERHIRATTEEDAAKKIQAELDQPYGFIGGWKTVSTDMDIVEVASSLGGPPTELGDTQTMLLSIRDAGKHLGISVSTMYDLVNTGEIEHVAVGSRRYIYRDALKAFIEANSHAGIAYRFA